MTAHYFMKPRLIIPVGLPGCGKTTWCKTLLDARRVSSDEIRLKHCPDAYDASKNAQVFAEFHEQIEYRLLREVDVVADATNLNARSRANLYGIAERCDAYIHVVLFTNVQEAVARNAARPVNGGRGNEPVPPEAMRDKMIPQYEDTLHAIRNEPIDSLTIIESVT